MEDKLWWDMIGYLWEVVLEISSNNKDKNIKRWWRCGIMGM